MDNSKGHGKFWKMMIMSLNFYNCTEKFCSRQKFLPYVEAEKKKKVCIGRGQKRKLFNNEIDELQ